MDDCYRRASWLFDVVLRTLPTASLCVACSLHEVTPDEAWTPKTTSTSIAEVVPVTEMTFVNGPSVEPASDLRVWLGRHRGRLLQLPVVVEWSGMDVGQAWLGMTDADPVANAVRIQLDQSALGVGLAVRLRSLCDKAPARCVVWLQGYWGPTVDLPGPLGFDRPMVADGIQEHPFSVRMVMGLVGEDDAPHVRIAEK